MKYFIGMDLGTQSAKGLLFNGNGDIACEASVEYLPDFPQPGYAEQDVNVWVKATKDIIAKLSEKANITADDIGSIAFASQCGGMVPVDAQNEPLRKCILWLDKRAEDQCDRVKAHITDDEAFELIGSPISASLRAMKIMWVKEHEPEIFEKSAAFLEAGEYMVLYLTGVKVSDYAHASITGLYDVATRQWSQKMSDITGVSLDYMVDVKPAYDVAGTVLPDVAKLLGLNSDTIVTVGTGDQHASTIGAGLVGTGDILNVMGTSEIVAVASDHIVYDKHKILRPHLHVNPKYWQIEQGAMISGAAVRWYRDNVSHLSYKEMDELAVKAPVGSNGLVFFGGLSGTYTPVINGHARGFFFGLSMSHTQEDMARSVLEGCAYGFRDNIESIREMGLDKGDIICGGGGTKSSVWLQIKADLVGKSIKTLKNSDTTPLGAGMLAGVAQGNYASFEQAVEQLVTYDKIYTPNPENKEKYDEMYKFYRKIYFNSEPLFEHYKKG